MTVVGLSCSRRVCPLLADYSILPPSGGRSCATGLVLCTGDSSHQWEFCRWVYTSRSVTPTALLSEEPGTCIRGVPRVQVMVVHFKRSAPLLDHIRDVYHKSLPWFSIALYDRGHKSLIWDLCKSLRCEAQLRHSGRSAS